MGINILNCVICNSRTEILYEQLKDKLHRQLPGRYDLKRCVNCNLIFVYPPPDDKELKIHYPETYDVYEWTPSLPGKRKMFLIKAVAKNYFGYENSTPRSIRLLLWPFYACLSHLPFFRKNGRLLDIGCGTGTRLVLFKELGWKVEGLEMSLKAARTARSTGATIYNATLQDANLRENHYDVVYLNNVFEHFGNPRLSLEKIAFTLKNNGQLIMVVPNSNSLIFRIFGQNWFALEIPRHLFTYNRNNLQSLIQGFGFETKEVVYSNTLGSLTSSLAYKLEKPANTFASFERIFWLLSFVFDPLLNCLGIGDWLTIRAVLRKN